VPLEDEVSSVHVSEVLWRHADGFGVLLAPGDELGASSVRDHHCRAIVEAARRTCDVVVLHVPRGLDAIARAGLALADPVVVVLGLDVLSFRDAKRAISADWLKPRSAYRRGCRGAGSRQSTSSCRPKFDAWRARSRPSTRPIASCPPYLSAWIRVSTGGA